MRKHRLAERLLVDIIGLDWDKAHVEAGRWEHVISDDVEDRLVVLLGNPDHLSPRQPHPRRRTDRSRAAAPGRGPARRPHPLERITESVEHEAGVALLPGDHGLTPGTPPLIQARAPDGTLTLVVGDATIALGPAMTQRMFVASA